MGEYVEEREVTETLIAVEVPRFVAGVVARDGRVVEVAPILRRHIKRGWDGHQVADYCRRKGWTWERCKSPAGSNQPAGVGLASRCGGGI